MLEELSQKAGDTVIIAVRSGIYAQHTLVLQARATMRFHVPPGSRRLVVWSATGFSLLTSSSDKEIRSLCTRTNAEAALDISRIDIDQVMENVERTRRERFFFSAGLVTPGAGPIAVPLPEGIDGCNHALAVAVSGPLQDVTRRQTEIVMLLSDGVQRYLRSTAPI